MKYEKTLKAPFKAREKPFYFIKRAIRCAHVRGNLVRRTNKYFIYNGSEQEEKVKQINKQPIIFVEKSALSLWSADVLKAQNTQNVRKVTLKMYSLAPALKTNETFL